MTLRYLLYHYFVCSRFSYSNFYIEVRSSFSELMSHESYILPENPFLSISISEKRVSNKLKNHMLETRNTRVMKNKTRKISAILFTLVYFKESSQICSYFMRYLIEMKANF